MQKQEKLLVPQGPDAVHEERVQRRREEERERTEEERRDFNEAQRAIDAGHETFDLRGRRIRGRGRNPLIGAIYPYSVGSTVSKEFERFAMTMSWGLLMKNITTLYAQTAALMATIAPAPAPTNTAETKQPDVQQDDHYVYDQFLVSGLTYERLSKEISEVRSLSARIDASTDPWEENDMRDVRTQMMEDYCLRPMPGSRGYVHCQSRVEALEEGYNTDGTLTQSIPVMVYRVRGTHHDSRTIAMKVGDPNNFEPQEIIVSGDHLKGQVVATNVRPEFNFDS